MNLLTLLLSLTSLVLINHDIQLATFTIYKESSALLLDIKMDIEDVADEIDVESRELTSQLVEEYLNRQTAFFFDGQRSLLQIQTLSLSEDHVNIQLLFDESPTSFDTIEIHNTCLLTLEDQSNVIALRFKNMERDFLMNKSRTIIEVEL